VEKMSINPKIAGQTESIKNALKQFKHGATLETIKTVSGLDIELRTLQRRLADLKTEGFIKTTGTKRSTLYHLTNTNVTPATRRDEVLRTEETGFIPLSAKGKEIHNLLSRPEQVRTPVTYNRYLLDAYEPNVNSYLTPEEKKKLAAIGKTAKSGKPAGAYAKEILSRLLIDLSWNSSRLDSNAYSLLDTERLIAHSVPAENKSAMEAQMILNHKDAIEFIVLRGEDIGFNRYTILNLHALLSNNLLPDPAAAGTLRTIAISIQRSVFTPLAGSQQIENLFKVMLEKAKLIKDPFEQAFFIMVHLPYLQPFDDVNERVSRLAANISFTAHNLAPLSFIDVPADLYTKGMLGVYELNQTELLKDIFLWAYERSSLRYAAVRHSLGEPDLFRLKYREELRATVTHIIASAGSRMVASEQINAKASQLPLADRQKFIESVETELLSMHEGNFARYLVKPAEFRKWKHVWDSE
jgi:Fic family protein